MAIDLQKYVPICDSSQSQLLTFIDLLNTLSELASRAKPNQPAEMIPVQELWAIRTAVIEFAKCWDPCREAFRRVAGQMESLATQLAREPMVAIPRQEYEFLLNVLQGDTDRTPAE